VGCVGIGLDITERKKNEELAHLRNDRVEGAERKRGHRDLSQRWTGDARNPGSSGPATVPPQKIETRPRDGGRQSKSIKLGVKCVERGKCLRDASGFGKRTL